MIDARDDKLGYLGRRRDRRRKLKDREIPYDPAEFAEKHGRTLSAAAVIITANGPSRHVRCRGVPAELSLIGERHQRAADAVIDDCTRRLWRRP